MNKILPTFAVVGLLTLSGCASIATDDQQTVNVTTSTDKAIEVSADGTTVTTPGTLVVLRDGKDKAIRTSDADCDATTPLEKEVAPMFFGNLLFIPFGTFFGSTTDASTGKMWDYADDVEITCQN